MSETILVTGANGLVSSSVIDGLLQIPDIQVRALVHDEPKAYPLKGRGVDVVAGDLDDPHSLTKAFEGVDKVWSLVPFGPAAPQQSSNITWAARQGGVRKVVRMSAIGAASDAPTRNGRLHALSDAELQGSGLDWTIVRPHFFMQNLLAAAPFISEYGVFQLAMAAGGLGMVDTRDIGATAARLLTTDTASGQVLTLTGPSVVDFDFVAAAIGNATGAAVTYEPIGLEALRDNLGGSGMSQWLIDGLVEYNEAYAAGWGAFTTTAVADVTGRAPLSIEQFARDFAAAFMPPPKPAT